MKQTSLILLCLLLLTGCGLSSIESAQQISIPETISSSETAPTELPPETEAALPDSIDILMQSMTLEDWVGQLFLAGADANLADQHIRNYNLGGFLLFSGDFLPCESAAEKITGWQEAAAIPLLIAVDEEGGTVARISCHTYFRGRRFSSPRELYSNGGIDKVLAEETEKCMLLSSLGVNVNLGPVCDISTDSDAFMYRRSLGQDALTTGDYVAQTVQLKQSLSIGSTLKHFPGYGNNTDTHTGIAVDSRTLEELESCDLIPFRSGIDAGAEAVMVSHTVISALDTELPASLSPAVIRYLRENMGFEGVILTDDLTMQAITDRYGAGEAAVMAIQAGCDMLCCSAFQEQYEAVLSAVLDGTIAFDTLKNAVRNVLEWKQHIGLI